MPGKDDVVQELPLDKIDSSPFQPREIFDERALAELAESIRVHGLQQAVVVRRQGARYELVMGERRCRASRLAGLRTVLARVRVLDDQEAAELCLTENLVRHDLDPLEEAGGYQMLLDRGLTVVQVAERCSRRPADVTYKLDLLRLLPEIKVALRAKTLPEMHAHELTRLSTAGQQRAWPLVKKYGFEKIPRLVSSIQEMERQPALFEVTPHKREKDAELKARFEKQLDRVMEAVAGCFQKDEPAVVSWVLTEDLRHLLPKMDVLVATFKRLRWEIRRSVSRRKVAGLAEPDEPGGLEDDEEATEQRPPRASKRRRATDGLAVGHPRAGTPGW